MTPLAALSPNSDFVTACYIVAFSLFIFGIQQGTHPRTARRGNLIAAALVTRRPARGVIFHSDRGCQYTSREFADFCANNGVTRSMGRRATSLLTGQYQCFPCSATRREMAVAA